MDLNTTKKQICPTCGKMSKVKLTCDDCIHSFVTPFDERFCFKNKTATKICKYFKKKP